MKESISQALPWSPEDIEGELKERDPELLRYIQLLPQELWSRHFQALQKIEKTNAEEDPAAVRELRVNYILKIIESREKAIETFQTREPDLQGLDTHVIGEQLRSLLVSRGNNLGAGMTARVKSLELESGRKAIAVKYLLTPTQKTLSVDGEYDIAREIEIISGIESREKSAGTGDRISLPHPLFYYKRGRIQCYGMEQVNGITLKQLTEENAALVPHKDAILKAIRSRYASDKDRRALYEEVENFTRAMHEICLHGDIKPANIMIDEEGKLYLIDFGQAVRANDMSDDTQGQYDNLDDMERSQMRECVTYLLKLVEQEEDQDSMPMAA